MVTRRAAITHYHHYFTNPGLGETGSGLATGGPIDNSTGAGHAAYSSGSFQGDLGEGLRNAEWRVQDEDQANGGDQVNSPAS